MSSGSSAADLSSSKPVQFRLDRNTVTVKKRNLTEFNGSTTNGFSSVSLAASENLQKINEVLADSDASKKFWDLLVSVSANSYVGFAAAASSAATATAVVGANANDCGGGGGGASIWQSNYSNSKRGSTTSVNNNSSSSSSCSCSSISSISSNSDIGVVVRQINMPVRRIRQHTNGDGDGISTTLSRPSVLVGRASVLVSRPSVLVGRAPLVVAAAAFTVYRVSQSGSEPHLPIPPHTLHSYQLAPFRAVWPVTPATTSLLGRSTNHIGSVKSVKTELSAVQTEPSSFSAAVSGYAENTMKARVIRIFVPVVDTQVVVLAQH